MKIEAEEFDETVVTLDPYNSDLNLVIDGGKCSAKPLTTEGFAFMWAGARATHGSLKGRYCYEVKILSNIDVSHLPADEPNPHVVRVGFSVESSTLQLGEDPLSYGYGGTGKISTNCQFKDFGEPFAAGDVILGAINADSDMIQIGFAKNGKFLGWAYRVGRNELKGQALFPHVLTKNVSFEVNFGQKEKPYFPLPDALKDFSFIGCLAIPQRVGGTRPPLRREDCEMIMMCGLPGAGKSVWAADYSLQHPQKKFNVLGTNNIIDKMKVMGLPRKRNYHGRWDVLIQMATKCLNKMFEIGSKLKRNYILDQTNVYPTAQRRKMRNFEGFIRKAVVVVPTDVEYKRRCDKRDQEEGKEVPDHAVLEMKANFKLPEVNDIFNDVVYTELQKEDAEKLVIQYNEEGKAAVGPPKKFFKSNDGKGSRFDSPREDRNSPAKRENFPSHGDSDDRPRGGFEGGRGGFDRNRGGFERGRGGFDRNRGGRGGFDRNRGGFEGGRGGRGGFDRNRGGFEGGRGGFDRNRGGFEGGRGGFDRNRGGYEGGRGGFDRNRGGFEGGRGGFDRNRGGFEGGRGGFDRNRGGFEGGRGGFDRNRGFEGGYDGGRGGFNRGREDFDQGGYDRSRGGPDGFDRNRGGRFDNGNNEPDMDSGYGGRGGYNNSRGGYDSPRGGFDRKRKFDDDRASNSPGGYGGKDYNEAGGNGYRGGSRGGRGDYNRGGRQASDQDSYGGGRDNNSSRGGYRGRGGNNSSSATRGSGGYSQDPFTGGYQDQSSGYQGGYSDAGSQRSFKKEPEEYGSGDSGRNARSGGRASRWSGADSSNEPALAYGGSSSAQDKSSYSSYTPQVKSEPVDNSSAYGYSSYTSQVKTEPADTSAAYGYDSYSTNTASYTSYVPPTQQTQQGYQSTPQSYSYQTAAPAAPQAAAATTQPWSQSTATTDQTAATTQDQWAQYYQQQQYYNQYYGQQSQQAASTPAYGTGYGSK
ncbi:hypothetical protein JTE90_026361 [Oedothorax gibbosus]|uniref:B30.2/SPRY domain-containing protein n=2 Tax=Oedothorax gibbosus TaxID=931172 RepID=A0AAV6UKW0_9ARAC|nr:hypothetical protein JTE90_026361 [Oedothorax gibbosus]